MSAATGRRKAKPAKTSTLELLLRAEACLKSGDLEAAIEALDQVIARDPDNIPGRHMRGLAHLRNGAADKAVSDLTKASEDIETDPSLFVNLGIAYCRTGDAEAAVAYLTRATKTHSPFPPALYHLGLVERRRGNGKAAVEALERCLALQPTYFKARLALAEVLIEEERWGDAEAVHAALVQRAPEDDALRVAHGRCLLEIGRPEDAREIFAEVLARSPDRAGSIRDHLEKAGRGAEAEVAARIKARLGL